MAQSLSIDSDTAARVSLRVGGIRLTDDQFYRLCADNPELRLELTADGDLIIMPPTFSGAGWRELAFGSRLEQWAREDGTGIAFGPSTGFTLYNGAKRSPDVSWVLHSRWKRLGWNQQNREFAPICPDFVAQLRSPSDRVADLRDKMVEYRASGARLGWLLDPIDARASIYRPGQEPVHLDRPEILSGEDVLPGFQFNFSDIVESKPDD